MRTQAGETVVAMTTYTAIASPDERCWHVRIQGLGNRPEYGLPTMARTLAEMQPMARDLIALWLEGGRQFGVSHQRAQQLVAS
jgi:hypothetical protein